MPRATFLHNQRDNAEWLDFSLVNSHVERFQGFMSMLGNPDREGNVITNQVTLNKYCDRILDFLAFQALRCEYPSRLSFESLLWVVEDFWIVTSYIQDELVKKRANTAKTITQAITAIRHGVSFGKWMGWWSSTEENYQALLAKLDRCANNPTGGVNTHPKKKHKASDVPLPEVMSKVAEFTAGVQSAWDSATDLHDHEVLKQHCSDLHSALMFQLTFERGGRSVDFSRAIIAFHDELLDPPEGCQPRDGEALVLVKKLDNGTVVTRCYLWSKNHYIYLDGANSMTREACRLCESLFLECATWVKDGDAVFTPSAHGSEESKAKVISHFADAAKFSDYFVIKSAHHLGLEMRPNRARSLVATHLNREGASNRLMASQAARAGSSVANMQSTYNAQSQAEKASLSNQLSRFQFDPRFNSDTNTFAVMTIGNGSPRQLKLARLIRQVANGQALVALFDEVDGHQQLTNKFLLLPKADFPRMQVCIDGTTGMQVWRNEIATTVHAHNVLEQSGLDSAEIILDTLVNEEQQPTVGDMVQLPHLFALGEVIRTDGSTIEVALAREVAKAKANSNVCFYRFEYQPEVAKANRHQVQFPLDLKFHGISPGIESLECAFELRKSEAMQTV